MTHLPISQQITFLYTGDLAETPRFYEEVLELPLTLDQGTCRLYRIGIDAYLGFCQSANAPQPPAGIIVTLVSPDVDGWYHYLCDKGVKFEKPPEVNPKYNIYHCLLRDPNGYLIEIQRFLDPTWSGEG